MVGTLSAAEAARQPDPPPMVERSSTTTIDPGGSGGPGPAEPAGEVLYAVAASGLLSFGGIVLVGGVIGLGGLRVPGGVSMTVARSRLWYRSVRRTGGHRAP
ncbi:hypothetical protein GCM10010170_112810 [Dactylosporangium salmoneum]|uniref:Uncharacterized protein n=1 Tax=Dactylosporangium salmoneum TaxID=53361 RepID=A0ABP5VB07_9ACTN